MMSPGPGLDGVPGTVYRGRGSEVPLGEVERDGRAVGGRGMVRTCYLDVY